MESNMFIPVWIKIFGVIFCALVVFILAARELVAEWIRGVARFLMNKPRRVLEGSFKEEIKLGKETLAKQV